MLVEHRIASTPSGCSGGASYGKGDYATRFGAKGNHAATGDPWSTDDGASDGATIVQGGALGGDGECDAATIKQKREFGVDGDGLGSAECRSNQR